MSVTSSKYEPADRRPIASRERTLWKRLAAALAAHRVSPNAISVAGMAVGVVAGALFAATAQVGDGWVQRAMWVAAAAGIQFRLLANMLDGMVALASGRASPVGELYNEIPDRISDLAIMVGAGYAVGGIPWLGYIAACFAILTAYVRAVGKAAGASNLFVGPMAKPQRMFVLTLAGLGMGLLPAKWQFSVGENRAGLVAAALAIIIFGGLVTVFRRLGRIARHLQQT